MSDMTNEQIIEEFKRQARLCSGIGKAKMLEIVEQQFDGKKKHAWRFYMNGSFCERCGVQLGSPQSVKGECQR